MNERNRVTISVPVSADHIKKDDVLLIDGHLIPVDEATRIDDDTIVIIAINEEEELYITGMFNNDYLFRVVMKPDMFDLREKLESELNSGPYEMSLGALPAFDVWNEGDFLEIWEDHIDLDLEHIYQSVANLFGDAFIITVQGHSAHVYVS